MEKKKIERINFLARKSKSEGLTEEEKAEQEAGFRKSLAGQLENTVVIDEYGNKTKLSDYNKNSQKLSDRKE